MTGAEVLKSRAESLARLKSMYGDDAETVIADARYGFISGLLKDVVKRPSRERATASDKIDKVVVNRWLGIPLFIGVMYCVFQFVFAVSPPLMDLLDAAFGWLGGQAAGVSPEWLGSLLADGIIGGLGSVLVFVPPIFLLFIAISALEDSGYMARAAFVMDRAMHKVGLHGRSFIPMILGFGCNIPGIMACRTIENPRDRLTTILVNPFMSCGARLPVFVLLAAAFFPTNQGLVVFSMYIIGVVAAIIGARIQEEHSQGAQRALPDGVASVPYAHAQRRVHSHVGTGQAVPRQGGHCHIRGRGGGVVAQQHALGR